MRFLTFTLVLVAVLAFNAQAAPEPEPAKGLRIAFPRSRATGVVKGETRKTESSLNDERATNADEEDDSELDELVVDDADMKQIDSQSNKNSDPSKGRLFFNKLMFFRNPQQPPVIPIIITSGAATAPFTSPTTSTPITSPLTTGALPTAATSPVTGSVATSPTAPAAGGRRDGLKDQEDQPLNGGAAVVDEKELQAAYAAGAQEYVVTDQEIRGTSDAKANRAPASVNLRRPGSQGGQMITVRIPARYRNYFRNGQKVILNTQNQNRNRNRQVNRRVVQRRRNNRNRRRRAGNKRRRVNN